MKKYIVALENIGEHGHVAVGSKAAAMARLARHGLEIPKGVVICFDAYHRPRIRIALCHRRPQGN